MPSMLTPPDRDEYAEFYRGYVQALGPAADALAALERQQDTIQALRRLPAERAGFRYAPGKWSVRDVVGHLADAERVFSYRLMRIARGDATPLPGFDENAYVAAAGADGRPLEDLAGELQAIRTATIALVRSLDETALARRGTVNDGPASARGLAYVIAGHFEHHATVLRERYGVGV